MTRELIEQMQEAIVPYLVHKLKKLNYEGLGEADAEEAEKDLNEVFCLAIKALEQEAILDKIRAEIEEHAKINQNLNTDRARALCWCLDVIDKYKAESEE